VLHEVGHFSEDVSPWGVHDLATGVMEWTSTPVEPGAEQMIVRGQSAAAPLHLAPGTASLVRHRGARSPFVGFRLVID
jgi:formylglycine-generating enzyme required for sulfatase activity